MSGKNKNLLIVAAVIAFIGIFYFSTIRSGQYWGDDWAMYIHHARNIAEGRSYQDTGYIYNPHYPDLGPRNYPPVFPLLLAPVYHVFGLNLEAMKLEIVVIFLAFLLTFFFVFRNETPFHYLVATISVLGFNPFMWEFKDAVVSDIPFLFFLYPSLYFMQRAYQQNTWGRHQLLPAFLVSLLAYLSYGTRAIGIALIPALLLTDLIRFRKLTRFSIMVTVFFGLLVALQAAVLHSESSYLDQFAFGLKAVVRNFPIYVRALSMLWDSGGCKVFRVSLFIGVSGLSIFGYLKKARDKVTIFEVFAPVYLLCILLWPQLQGLRYLLPVVPLYILYSFMGINRLNSMRSGKLERPVFLVMVMAIAVTYAVKYSKTNYGPIMEGIDKEETTELFNFIKHGTDKSDVFVFRRPRALSLFTERSATVYHQTQEDAQLWDYFRKIGATYVIVGPIDEPFFREFVERNKDKLCAVYSNADFKVYRINSWHINEIPRPRLFL